MQYQPSRGHGEAADIQINVVLAPDQVEQILGGLTGGDWQGCKVFLFPERALAGFAGLGGHGQSLSLRYACTAGCGSLLSPSRSASRSAMARSSSGERLAHCS